MNGKIFGVLNLRKKGFPRMIDIDKRVASNAIKFNPATFSLEEQHECPILSSFPESFFRKIIDLFYNP
jgi:hypothetical protein